MEKRTADAGDEPTVEVGEYWFMVRRLDHSQTDALVNAICQALSDLLRPAPGKAYEVPDQSPTRAIQRDDRG
jgi:hypothetical protein